MFDWDDLRYFLAVARTGSLTLAARDLGVTQPTVGRRLTTLADRLGAELLVRTNEGQSLTATGRQLLEHAERMEAEALAVERRASGRDRGISGKVTISASEWMVDRVLAPLVGRWLEQQPALELDLVAEARHVSLGRREADVAIRLSPFQQHGVVQRAVGRVAFGLYASDGYLARHGHPHFGEDTSAHRLIAMSEGIAGLPEHDWLPRFAPELRVAARSNGRLSLATLASRDIGLTVLPRYLGDGTASLRLLGTPVPAPIRRLWLGYHEDSRRIPRVRRTAVYLMEALEHLHPALCPDGP